MIDVAQAISSFSPVQPADQLVTLTIGQLQDLIKEAVTVAIQPLQDRIESLEATIASQSRQITALEQDRDLAADRDLNQLRLISGLREQIQPEETIPTEKTTDHIDQLARVMTEDKRRSVSVATAAKLLGLSKERMRQLKPLLLADSRFELGWDRQRGQRKRVVIRLKQFIK